MEQDYFVLKTAIAKAPVMMRIYSNTIGGNLSKGSSVMCIRS